MRHVIFLMAVMAGVAATAAAEAPDSQPGSDPIFPLIPTSSQAPATSPVTANAPAIFAATQPSEDNLKDWAFTAYWENDSHGFRPGGFTDRHYTNGMELTLAHHPQWAEDLEPFTPFHEPFDGGRTAAGYALGQNLYTPNDLTRKNPDPDDWPYAAWLYGGLYWQRATDSGLPDHMEMMDHFQLTLGMVGPAAQGAGLQEWWHHVVGAQDPQGWNYQLNDEFGFDFMYQRHWRYPLFSIGPVEAQAIPRAGFTAGTFHRQGDADVTFRIGKGLPDDYGLGRIEEPAAATGLGHPWHSYVYAFVRAGGEVVEHDIFLNGNTFGDSRGVTPKPLVGVLQTGIVWAISKHVEGSWSITYLTKEFDGQESADSYGAFTITAYFDF